VDDELDDTVTVPRRPVTGPIVRPTPSTLTPDVESTVIPTTGRNAAPPPLVEPELKPRFTEPSGVELTPSEPIPIVSSPEDVATRAYSLADLEAAQTQQFYRFRIGKTVVWLDAVSYVGRRPSSPRIIYGQMPRLVRVPSPKQEVSSTHVELRQLGASVVLTDMKSTNGSTVFPPGGEPRKLRQGESIVATPGTLVDIGDGNVIEILPQEMRARSEGSSGASEGRQ
jgi:hypothetical protein